VQRVAQEAEVRKRAEEEARQREVEYQFLFSVSEGDIRERAALLAKGVSFDTLLAAEQQAGAVGFTLWTYNYSTWEGRPGLFLEDIFVEENARRLGIGQMLMADLARRALAAGQVPKAGGLRPQVFLHVQADTLAGAAGSPAAELAPGEATVSGQTARMLACDAVLTPFVWSSDGRLLDVGRSTRTVPTLLRRAVVGRDRRCVFAGCGRPLTWCDAHHIVHWARGGPTRLDNLVLLCRHHHTLVHQHDLAITPATTGRGWTFTHPDGTVFHGPPGPRRRARRRWAA